MRRRHGGYRQWWVMVAEIRVRVLCEMEEDDDVAVFH